MSIQIHVGDIVQGKVAQIKPFGAFIQIDEKNRGLVHISQVSNSYVKEITDVINVGDQVSVKVLSIEENGNKISLSIKQAVEQESPKEEPSEKPEREAVSFIDSNKTNTHLENLLKEFTRQSNERHADINKRLKR